MFRTRGYLPHLESSGATYFVTFRLAGTLPRALLDAWREEANDSAKLNRENDTNQTPDQKREAQRYYADKIERYLDSGKGECWLRHEEIAKIVVAALKFFDHSRYELQAWCVMPNHVHVVLSTKNTGSRLKSVLIPILHSWKSYTAKKANLILGRTGKFWQEEYYDHLIRNQDEFLHSVQYTLENPVKAGLCDNWQDWPYSGVSESIGKLL